MVVTHGYYYDRAGNAPVWLSDTWTLDAAHEPHTWKQLLPHLPQQEAYEAYSAGRVPKAPCGRFGHASALVGDHLYLYGGHDGGYSRTNRPDYKPGNDFEELWRLDLAAMAWSRAEYSPGPGRRYLHAATAVQGRVILYGGSQDGQGDVWSYDAAAGAWERLAGEVSEAEGGPGRRLGHALVGWEAGPGVAGVVLLGGRTGNVSAVRQDVWWFDLGKRSWRQLRQVAAAGRPGGGAGGGGGSGRVGDGGGEGGGGGLPPGRMYLAAMETTVQLPSSGSSSGSMTRGHSSGDGAGAGGAGGGGAGAAAGGKRAVRVGVVAGGTLTTPGLKCAADAWAFTVDCTATQVTWTHLPDMPAALYDTRGAAWGGRVFVYGGHLCHLEKPAAGAAPYDYYYVNEVYGIDLTGHVSGEGGCEVREGAAGAGARQVVRLGEKPGAGAGVGMGVHAGMGMGPADEL